VLPDDGLEIQGITLGFALDPLFPETLFTGIWLEIYYVGFPSKSGQTLFQEIFSPKLNSIWKKCSN
jgi:hypothetical protein